MVRDNFTHLNFVNIYSYYVLIKAQTGRTSIYLYTSGLHSLRFGILASDRTNRCCWVSIASPIDISYPRRYANRFPTELLNDKDIFTGNVNLTNDYLYWTFYHCLLKQSLNIYQRSTVLLIESFIKIKQEIIVALNMCHNSVLP